MSSSAAIHMLRFSDVFPFSWALLAQGRNLCNHILVYAVGCDFWGGDHIRWAPLSFFQVVVLSEWNSPRGIRRMVFAGRHSPSIYGRLRIRARPDMFMHLVKARSSPCGRR